VDTSNLSEEKKVMIDLYLDNPNDTSKHKLFFVRNIYIEPDYSISDTLPKDSVYMKNYTCISTGKSLFPGVFARHIRMKQNSLYKLDEVRQTISQLSEIQLFKYIDVSFTEILNPFSDTGYLDCNIRLTPMRKQEITVETELNTTAETKIITATSNRYYGMAGSINYRNRNVARRALQFSFGVLGAFDVQSKSIADQLLFGNYQLGFNTGLLFPTAFLPRRVFKPTNYQSTKTAVNFSYFYEFNQDYQRTSSNLAYIYQFNKRYTRNFFTPLELNLVKTNLDDEFAARLSSFNDPLLDNVFETHLLTITKYSVSYNDKGLKKDRYWNMVFGIETAGNTGWLYNKLTSDITINDTTHYSIAGVDFFQYVKTDLDISYHYNLNNQNTMAARFLFGFGMPYGNSNLLPFEKRYYIGGANSLRAWPMREVGPGSYRDTSNLRYEQSGEIKIEASMEYRFTIYSILKGALFVDAGNIWNLKKDLQRPGGEFAFDKFIPELAVGTGLGFRFDFTYFIFRLDFGVPIRDPSYDPDERWIIKDFDSFSWLYKNTHLNIGIGFPF
jgi:outer membrane protein assembly factor BamA